MDIEKKLMAMDFCRFSKVQDSLLQHLLYMRRQRNDIDELSLDELDSVAAAGDIHSKNDPAL